MTKKRPTLRDFKKQALKDIAFREAYEELRPEFELIEMFIKARKKSGYSQVELAQQLNIQQPTIARLEKGGYKNTSIAKLEKIADKLGYAMKISLMPKSSKNTKKF